MKKFKVLLSQTAFKELKCLSQSEEERIKKHLKELETNPYKSRPKVDIKKLSGFSKQQFYRLRVGDWRIIYAVLENEIRVTEIMRRGKGYSWLE